MRAKLAVSYIIGALQQVPVGCRSAEELTLSLPPNGAMPAAAVQYSPIPATGMLVAAGMSPLLARIEKRSGMS